MLEFVLKLSLIYRQCVQDKVIYYRYHGIWGKQEIKLPNLMPKKISLRNLNKLCHLQTDVKKNEVFSIEQYIALQDGIFKFKMCHFIRRPPQSNIFF